MGGWNGGWREGGTERGTVFCCCAQSVISLMKWSITQRKIAREGDFRKRRTGCPLLPARPVEYHISISLVKSDWKLQQKTAPPRQPPFRSPRLHFILSARALIKIDFRGLPAFSTAPYKKFHNFLLLRSQYRCLP